MRIDINVDPESDDLHISITCPALTPDIERIIARLRTLDHQLTVRRDGETHLVDIQNILYIESVEGTCFACTADAVYESDLHLYELEDQLQKDGFFRISRTVLVQLRKIRSLRADINRRIRITMANGEQLIASRQYADALKKRLGVG